MFGLDISQQTLAVALVDPATRRLRWEREVPNTPEQVAKLLARVPADHSWVMEPTGRFSLAIAKQALAAGRTVLMAQPKRAKCYRQSRQSRAKTDRLDARSLAEYALSEALSPYPVAPLAVEQLQQLLAARRAISASIAAFTQRIPELPHAAAALRATVADLKAQLAALDRQIEAEKRQHLPAAAALEQVHGIGPVTATAVAACLLSKQFRGPEQFVAYVGLDVAVWESGKRKGERGLSKQGDAELRRLLYVCAKASLRAKGSPFRAQYEREREKGLSATAALCAVARKMAKLCWSLARHGTTYDPDRVYQQLRP